MPEATIHSVQVAQPIPTGNCGKICALMDVANDPSRKEITNSSNRIKEQVKNKKKDTKAGKKGKKENS